MTFKYPVCIRGEADIDELIKKWNTSPIIVNYLTKHLDIWEYSLINFIVNEGLRDILGQQPDIEEPDDDPFAKPNPDSDIRVPILDDDPFATPNVWDRDHPAIYDEDTNTLRNGLGQVFWSADMTSDESPVGEYPYVPDWIEFFTTQHVDEKVPFPPMEPEDPYYDDFMVYLAVKYGDCGCEPAFTIEEV